MLGLNMLAGDPLYDPDEKDLLKSNALNDSLFELTALEKVLARPPPCVCIVLWAHKLGSIIARKSPLWPRRFTKISLPRV